jgi:hypothetical protein
MSQCDPDKCNHSSHAAAIEEPEKFLEVKPVPPIQVETAAMRRFDAIAAAKEKRDAERARQEGIKAEETAPPAPAPQPEYVPSAQVKQTQKLLEMIELRKRVRARWVAEKNSRALQIETELRQAMKDRDARLEAVEAKAREDLAAISAAFESLGQERAAELNLRDLEITKVDKSLDQLRKQLQAELAKVDEDLARKGA